jgi:hypothetical protein
MPYGAKVLVPDRVIFVVVQNKPVRDDRLHLRSLRIVWINYVDAKILRHLSIADDWADFPDEQGNRVTEFGQCSNALVPPGRASLRD